MLCAFICFPYLCTFAALKNHVCSHFLICGVRAYLIYRENVYKRIICRLQPFSSLLDTKYMFCRLSDFAAVFSLDNIVSTTFRFWYVCSRLFSVSVFTRFLFHEICAWNIMQVSAYLCKVKMYIYAILW